MASFGRLCFSIDFFHIFSFSYTSKLIATMIDIMYFSMEVMP